MEMPEGWKRVTKAVIDMRKWEEEGRPGDRFATFDMPWCGDIAEAMSLMKEMAKVLVEIQEAGTEEVYLPEEGKHDIVMNGYAVDAKIVLDKFKEWK